MGSRHRPQNHQAPSWLFGHPHINRVWPKVAVWPLQANPRLFMDIHEKFNISISLLYLLVESMDIPERFSLFCDSLGWRRVPPWASEQLRGRCWGREHRAFSNLVASSGQAGSWWTFEMWYGLDLLEEVNQGDPLSFPTIVGRGEGKGRESLSEWVSNQPSVVNLTIQITCTLHHITNHTCTWEYYKPTQHTTTLSTCAFGVDASNNILLPSSSAKMQPTAHMSIATS